MISSITCSSPHARLHPVLSRIVVAFTGSRCTKCRRVLRNGRGKPIVNMFPLEEGEKINAILSIKEFVEDRFIFLCTAQGTVKKTPLSDFSNPRKAASSPWRSTKGDFLIGAEITNGTQDIVLVSECRQGRLVRRGGRAVPWAVRRAVCVA